MAKQDAEKFLQFLSSDIGCQTQLLTVDTVDGVLDYAMTKGYVFTQDDLKAALKDYPEDRAVDKLRTKLKMPGRPAPAGSS
jgi:hypothetical protein